METTQIQGEFISKLQNSLETGTFVKLTLSKPGGKDKDLRNVFARLVEIKDKSMLSFTLRYPTKDITKNHPVPEAITIIGLWLGNDFLNGDLYTTEGDFFIQYNKKRVPRLFSKSSSHQVAPASEHNKQKSASSKPRATSTSVRWVLPAPTGRYSPPGKRNSARSTNTSKY